MQHMRRGHQPQKHVRIEKASQTGVDQLTTTMIDAVTLSSQSWTMFSTSHRQQRTTNKKYAK